MSALLLSTVSLALAAVPAGLFLANLRHYRRTPTNRSAGLQPAPQVSLLIPARNEEASIGTAVESALACTGVDLEVIVMDDRSEDRTAEIVQAIAARDPRVRLLSGTPLPDGWCGKQFACDQLARHASHEWLVFMDADVRLEPDALARMAGFMHGGGAALASGVPRQITATFLERLLLPLIHFVLLGFLPMGRMRRSTKPGYAAGCGQLFIARRDAYEAAGGHSSVKASLHDGIQLPRAFRRAGFSTDLFDATNIARCRMYRNASEVWRGLGKNATEGLGSPGLIGPMTLLLAGGQILPVALVAHSLLTGSAALPVALLAAILAWLPRIVAARHFDQSALGALLHPLGVLLLLAIQWEALLRKFSGAPMRWKGRAYGGSMASPTAMSFAKRTAAISLGFLLLSSALVGLRGDGPSAANDRPLPALTRFTLSDQFSTNHAHSFPRERPMVVLLADREASKIIKPWIEALIPVCEGRFDLVGVADVRGAPKLFHGRIRSGMRDLFHHPVLLDWRGDVCDRLTVRKNVPSVILLQPDGIVSKRVDGPYSVELLGAVTNGLAALSCASPTVSN